MTGRSLDSAARSAKASRPARAVVMAKKERERAEARAAAAAERARLSVEAMRAASAKRRGLPRYSLVDGTLARETQVIDGKWRSLIVQTSSGSEIEVELFERAPGVVEVRARHGIIRVTPHAANSVGLTAGGGG